MLPSIPYTENLPKLKKIETSTKIEIFSFVDNLVFTRKQKDPDLLKNLKALHQSTEIELKHIDSVLPKESEHDTNFDKDTLQEDPQARLQYRSWRHACRASWAAFARSLELLKSH